MANRFITNGVLQCNTRHYSVQLENISMTGVVVRLKSEAGEPLLPGERCLLMLYKNQENDQIAIQAQLVHYSFTLAALQFIEVDEETGQALEKIIGNTADEKNGRIFNASGLRRYLGITASGACLMTDLSESDCFEKFDQVRKPESDPTSDGAA